MVADLNPAPRSALQVCKFVASLLQYFLLFCYSNNSFLTILIYLLFLKIIPSLSAWNKVNYDNSLAIQATYSKAIFTKISSLGITGTGLRVFNVDNSVLGAGIHTRIWFRSNADCMLFQSNANSDAALATFLTPSVFGTPKLRMITMNKCHKWKVRSICFSFLCILLNSCLL
jgi:hypothetical protein